MKILLVTIITAVLILGIIGTIMTTTWLRDSYATKSITKQAQQPSNNTTIRPEGQSQQQPSEGNTDRQNVLQFNTEQSNAEDQQEDENNVIGLKEEQIKGVGDEQENENEETNGDDENEIDARLTEADKKAPIAISGDNTYIVWFNDQSTPNNNSEILFRSSNNSGVTFSDKINLSNTTNANSVNAEIAADGNNVIITWWERNETSNEPVVRISNDNGATFGPVLKLATNGTIEQ
jgi:hypothetical protein